VIWSCEDVPIITGDIEHDAALHAAAIAGGSWPTPIGGYHRLPQLPLADGSPFAVDRTRPDGFDPSRSTEGNDWYGSRSILLRYAGIESNPALPGRYQHGWQFGTGVDGELSATVGVYLQYRWPIWVWNGRNCTKARHQGMRAISIGAPALYLQDLSDPGPVSDALLAIPMHSSPPYMIRRWSDYLDALAELARGFTETTVLLHFRDYGNMHHEVVRRGMRPITLGRQNAVAFLERLRYQIRRARIVTGERPCTAAFYAQLWSRPYLVHGPALEARHDGDGSADPFAGPAGERAYVARQFPHMLRGEIDLDSTGYELGIGEKRTSAEIREMFG
jgi:hypothetical protein